MVGATVVLECSLSPKPVHALSVRLLPDPSIWPPSNYCPVTFPVLLNFLVNSLIASTDHKLLGVEIVMYFFVAFLELHFE